MKAKSKKLKIPKNTETDLIVVKVGTETHPATEKDIQDVQIALAQCAADKNLSFITHHAIEFIAIKRAYLKNVIPCLGNIEKLG